MPSAKRQPEGSTADLPPDEQIAAAEESREQDIDSMFGISGEEEEVAAGAEGEATTPEGAAAGAAGVTPVDGQVATPALPEGQTPPDGTAVPASTATPGDGTSSAPPGQQPAQAGQTPAPAAATPPVAPVDPNLLRVNSLEATVQALQAELAAARAQPPAPGGAGATPQADGQPELPRYALQLPQAVAAALTSGDDAQTVAGVTHMMNSLASIVHHNVRLEMSARFNQLMTAAREQETAGENQRFIQDSRADYYKAFPTHNDPLILPLIQSESMAMAGEFPGAPWNENYRNALGQRVEARLAQLRGQAGVVTPPPAPAAMLPVGARPGDAPGGELTGGDLIADTFS